MGICKYCGKEFPNRSLGGHVARCKMNPNYKETSQKCSEGLKKATIASVLVKKLPRKEFKLICPKCGKEFIVVGTQNEFDKGKLKKFCSRTCANSRCFSEDTNKKKSNSLKQYYSKHDMPIGFYHKVKTYYCKQCGKPFTMKDIRDTGGRTYCCDECKQIWLKENLQTTFGGLQLKSGRSRSGWYKGIFCSSTWELAYLIYCLDHNIPIKRCEEIRTYIHNGKQYKYYPDFNVNGDIVEIKGLYDTKWESKLKYNPNVKVLYYNDIKPYIKYVESTYNKKLIELYDKSKSYKDVTNNSYYWVNNGHEEIKIDPPKLEEYINNGWNLGMLAK